MRKWKALIVDDERLARKDLIEKLAVFDCIDVLGEARDVPSASRMVADLNPDVIFLDIQMPGASGFELLDQIPAKITIIFVTAYDAYAIRAFEVNALDYILKPIDPIRLGMAVKRLAGMEVHQSIPEKKLEYEDFLFLMLDDAMRFLRICTIQSIRAAGNYSEVATIDTKRYLSVKSLKDWETRLPEKHFCRVHRSTIVNIQCVDRVEDWIHYSYRIYLRGEEEPLIMSRRHAHRLKHRFG